MSEKGIVQGSDPISASLLFMLQYIFLLPILFLYGLDATIIILSIETDRFEQTV